MNSRLKKFGQGLLVLLLASSFIALGIWQLHRAQDMKSSSTVAVDTHVYPLTILASPTGAIPPESIGKVVSTSGHYIANFKAPHQNDDRAENTALQLSRLDSSLLTGMTQMQLFDGFILEKSESTRAGAVTRTRISTPVLTTGIPGFYWQHISYVAIWWLMALVILWLPFYTRRNRVAL